MYSQSHIQLKTIAIFSTNKALSSLLHMVLAKNIQLRVREFTSEETLKQYMNISTIDLLIYDCEEINEEIISSIQNIKKIENSSNAKFQIITLCKSIPKGIRSICKSIGIDELIIKPMSPSYLETRVNGRLNQNNSSYPTSFIKKSYLKYTNDDKAKTIEKNTEKNRISTSFPKEKTNNIIPLFGNKNNPKSPVPTPPNKTN